MKKLTERQLITIALLLLPLLWFYSAVPGNVALVQGDGWTQHVGMRFQIGQMIASGMLPLWNPYVFGGMPLLAVSYPGALYPLNWVFAFLPVGAAINFVVIVTFHLALTGTYCFARALSINRLGALIAAIMFAFSGFMVISLGNTGKVAAAAWLPWVLLAMERIYQRAEWKWVTLGALFIGLQTLAGFPQMSFYTGLTAGAYFLFSITVREQLQPRFKIIGLTAMMALCGALLSMPHLLPLRELQQQSARSAIVYENFSSHHFPLRQLPALLFPYFFGGASLSPYKVPYWGDWGVYATAGYVGVTGLLLALTGVIALRRQRLVWFWVALSIIALLLAFGGSLPFGLNQLLYRLPVYNLFRTSMRHLLEFDLAMAVLAGLGVNCLMTAESALRNRVVRICVVVMTALVIVTALSYVFFLSAFLPGRTIPAGAGALLSAELLVPMACLIAGAIAVWLFTQRPKFSTGALLAAVLLLDLASYGQFLDWRTITMEVPAHLVDPPTVKFIKEREADLSSFRVLSYSATPFDYRYELLNWPSLSIVRRLQTVNGYDELQISRTAALMGRMDTSGAVLDPLAFDATQRGFDLLNVKYLLSARADATAVAGNVVGIVEHEGVRFNERFLDLKMKAGNRAELSVNDVSADELVLVSQLTNSSALPDNTVLAKIRLHAKDGQVIERELLAGRDSAEWAWDRADVKAAIKHARARVVESWPITDAAGNFEAHRYLSRFKFKRADISRIEFEHVQPQAELVIARASLFDSTAKTSTPLSELPLSQTRWKKLTSLYSVDIYENLHALPRAWLVGNVRIQPGEDILKIIRDGKLPDGTSFDPRQIALLDQEAMRGRQLEFQSTEVKDAQVQVTRYEPQRIAISKTGSGSGFLVLSEIFYPGWRALIDGASTPIYRTNYTLRGIVVPPGEHRIEFIYRPASFQNGVTWAGVGLLILLAGQVVTWRQKRR